MYYISMVQCNLQRKVCLGYIILHLIALMYIYIINYLNFLFVSNNKIENILYTFRLSRKIFYINAIYL